MIQKSLLRILGCALLSYAGAAPAFTLITPPEETSPSKAITEAITLNAQVQSLIGAIRTQLRSHRLLQGPRPVALAGVMLAANTQADRRSDVGLLAAAPSERSGAGEGGLGGTESLWISSAYNSLENEFSRTQFYGDTQNILVGFDVTRSDKYVLGIALNHEASNFITSFNAGNEKTRGYNVSPYFAYLLSDAWSVDFSLGYGDFKTRQSRSLLVAVPVSSELDSTRSFASANLTNVSGWGDWRLTSSLGATGTKRKQEAYLESDGTAIAGSSSNTIKQWNLSGELARGSGAAETYLGLAYEKIRDPLEVTFPFGEQPANDPDSVLVTAGWRYFARRLTASFVLSSRQAQDQVKEYGFSMLIRIDL